MGKHKNKNRSQIPKKLKWNPHGVWEMLPPEEEPFDWEKAKEEAIEIEFIDKKMEVQKCQEEESQN